MSFIRLLLASLRYHWRVSAAVAAGIATATAVLTGALVVGDSVRGSLAHLTLDRLGRIDDVLIADRFFRTALAGEWSAEQGFPKSFTAAVPAIVVEGSVATPEEERVARAGKVTILGCTAEFWSLGSSGPQAPPDPDQVVLNEPLAENLGVHVGDDVLVRIGESTGIPPESALGRKQERIRSRRLTISAIIPADGLGRFGLRPNQQLPYNAYANLKTLQESLEQPERVNALLVTGAGDAAPTAVADRDLATALHPSLDDYGLTLRATDHGYWQLTSRRMLLESVAEQAAEEEFRKDHPRAALTYLANTLADGDKQIPYSTICALNFATLPPQGPFTSSDGQTIPPLKDDEIALNAWAVGDLDAKLGDEIAVTYFEPETLHGQVQEKTARFRLAAIVAMTGPAVDRNLTPEVPGITDQKSIADWDPPFPFEPGRVRKQDEQYWDEYGTTPKAFVSLASGRRLWTSRFGDATSLQFDPPPPGTPEQYSGRLARRLEPATMGLRLMSVKRLGLAAASGTTPFSLLFLGFSFFIVAAAVMLVSLLFRLSIQQRSREIGIFAAVGLAQRQIVRLLAGEGLLVAAVGAAVGVPAGVGYAAVMLHGLRTWWVAAISTPFLQLHWTALSLTIGLASGVAVSLATMLWTLRQLGRQSVRQLLAGRTEDALARFAPPSRWAGWLAAGAALAALVAGFAALELGGEAQAGAFFGSGAAVLTALLALWWSQLRSSGSKTLLTTGRLPLARLAIRNGARNPTRSALTMGLMAAASFLIVAISAFQIDPASETGRRESGSGGFQLIAQSAQPVYLNLDSPRQRTELGFTEADNDLLVDSQIFSLRVQPGDDASCLNLYQPTQPRALGVPRSLVERGGFAWAGSMASGDNRLNPWLLLDAPAPAAAAAPKSPDAEAVEEPPLIPGVLDMATALYSLHLYKGVGEIFQIHDAAGRPLRIQLVGMLQNSIFQGDLLLSEENVIRYFPDASGYRMFLIDVDAPRRPIAGKLAPVAVRARDVRRLLEAHLGDYGFSAERTLDRLASLMAVQNTYLLTFQSLGGLGLLLGTFGLATVQLRSVLERRGELALLRAAGFRRSRLAWLVTIENAVLLVGGLGVGVAAAAVAVLPHLFGGEASLPIAALGGWLAIVLAVGLLAGLAAVRATLRADLVPALREE